jgi:aminoglycoside phosphotransferase (APT) family kinase protein
MPVAVAAEVAVELTESLRRMGLAEPEEQPTYTALEGGVSSGIWRADLRGGPVCLKRALARLRVGKDWFVPIERGQYEIAWFRQVASIVPLAVPKLLGVDVAQQLFALEFLDPACHPLWKMELREGRAEPAFAAQVGHLLSRIHAATAGRADVAAAFPSDAIFYAIRLEPYLEATAARHPDLAQNLHGLVQTTLRSKHALVHGDVSPKNILIGPAGPIFLDAECAWYGDPAFDPAFCLNHLLLKCLWTPRAAPRFLSCFDALAQAYWAGVTWEPRADIEARVAGLLAGLFLARIDGKSPVEYVTTEADQDRVRRVGRALIAKPPSTVATVRKAWTQELGIG